MKPLIKVSRSRTGLPVIVEDGGGVTSSGDAIIVAGENGERLTPLFIPKGRWGSAHALFVARPGMFIVRAEWNREGERVEGFRIEGVKKDGETEFLRLVPKWGWENGDGDIPDEFQKAADAAIEKAHCFHCREAHYVSR